MKKLIALSLLIGTIVNAQTIGEVVALELQDLTRTAPVAADFTSTASLDFDNIAGYAITVCAQSGATLTNVTLQGYVLDKRTGFVSKGNIILSSTGVSHRCKTFDDTEVRLRIGRIVMFASNGTTVSAGTQVTIYYRGAKSNASF